MRQRIRMRSVGLILTGVLVGMVMISPATAHLNQNTKHLGLHVWKQVIRQRVYTKAQANNRFLRTGQGLRLEPGATSPNVVGGHPDNTVTGGVSGGTIGGGGASGAANEVGGNYATVGGGRGDTAGGADATVGGGQDNLASGSGAVIAGGRRNEATVTEATVGGGRDNVASGDQSTIAGGDANVASGFRATVVGGSEAIAQGLFSTVAGGFRALAARFGELAYASGMFAEKGDAQASQFVLRRLTTDGATNELFLDGAGQRIALFPGQTLTFEGLVSARSDAGSSAGYRIHGVIKRVDNVTSFVGTPVVETLGENNAAWNVVLVANDTVEALGVFAQGEAATAIRWVATIETAQVGF